MPKIQHQMVSVKSTSTITRFSTPPFMKLQFHQHSRHANGKTPSETVSKTLLATFACIHDLIPYHPMLGSPRHPLKNGGKERPV